jgi:hypothetical protein
MSVRFVRRHRRVEKRQLTAHGYLLSCMSSDVVHVAIMRYVPRKVGESFEVFSGRNSHEPLVSRAEIDPNPSATTARFQAGKLRELVDNMLSCDRSNRRRPGLPHDHAQFSLVDVEHLLDARLTERGQTPRLGAADPNRARA